MIYCFQALGVASKIHINQGDTVSCYRNVSNIIQYENSSRKAFVTCGLLNSILNLPGIVILTYLTFINKPFKK